MKYHTLTLTILALGVVAPGATAFEKGNILVRGGFATVAPDASSTNIQVGDAELATALTADNNTQAGFTLAYFIHERINIELLAATPFEHDVNFSTLDPLMTGNQLGEITHLPPTLTANYYFNHPQSAFQPYIGAGVNYTLFFDEQFTSQNEQAGLSDLSLDNSFGLAAQLGADVHVADNWYVNAAIRWIDIDTEARFDAGGVAGRVDSITIDPWVYSISLGYRF